MPKLKHGETIPLICFKTVIVTGIMLILPITDSEKLLLAIINEPPTQRAPKLDLIKHACASLNWEEKKCKKLLSSLVRQKYITKDTYKLIPETIMGYI